MKKVKKTYETLTMVPVMVEYENYVLSGSIVDHATIRAMGQELAAPVPFDQVSADDGGHTFNHDWDGGSL